MKTRFFKRATAFAVAFLIALGVFTVLPEECLIPISIMVSAIDSTSANNIVDSGTCGENVTWTLSSNGVLTISGTGDMKNYLGYYKPWRDNEANIFSIIIKEGVTSIGADSFNGCSKLENIQIPDSITSIGESAFYGCESLMGVEIPNRINTIASSTFRGCNSIRDIIIPNNVTSIGEYAFSDCSMLEKIIIPNSIISMEMILLKFPTTAKMILLKQ